MMEGMKGMGKGKMMNQSSLETRYTRGGGSQSVDMLLRFSLKSILKILKKAS